MLRHCYPWIVRLIAPNRKSQSNNKNNIEIYSFQEILLETLVISISLPRLKLQAEFHKHPNYIYFY